MKLHRTTKIIIATVAAGLAAYDVLPFISEPDGDTISEVLASWGADSRAVPYVAGFLVGHFFWPGVRRLPHWAALGASAIVAGVFHAIGGHLPMIAAVIVGTVAGRVLWPLSDETSADPVD